MNCTHTTMFPKVKRVIKKLIKGNSFLTHENDPNGCSCCGGSIENLSLEELLALMKDGTFLKSYEIEKLYTWTFDKVKVYGVPLEHAKGCTCDAQVNYIGKQFGRFFHGSVILFKDKAHAETYTRQFQETKKRYLESETMVLERTMRK